MLSMKRKRWLLLSGILSLSICSAQPSVKNLHCESRVNPLGIDNLNPRFSWQMEADHANAVQTAYEIRVGSVAGSADVWGSGKRVSEKSIFVLYEGAALQSGTPYFWQVRIWDDKGAASPWSEKAFWQMGILKPSDWKASWIESGATSDSVNGPALLYRKSFNAGKKIISATAFISSH